MLQLQLQLPSRIMMAIIISQAFLTHSNSNIVTAFKFKFKRSAPFALGLRHVNTNTNTNMNIDNQNIRNDIRHSLSSSNHHHHHHHHHRLINNNNLRGGSADEAVQDDASDGSTITTTVIDDVDDSKSSSSSSSSSNPIHSTRSNDYYYNQTTAEIGSLETSQLLSELSTNPTSGLTSNQVSIRQSQYGPNRLESPPGKSLLTLVLEQFDDKLVQILLVVALVSGIFSYLEMKGKAHVHVVQASATGQAVLLSQNMHMHMRMLKSFIEPLIILTILILNGIVGVWQSKQAEGSLDALKKLQPSLTTVLRDGIWIDNADASELVPGDIIKVNVGDKISADARVLSLQSSILSLDEGSLTGESVTTHKLPGDEGLATATAADSDSGAPAPIQDMKGVVFSGTVCTAGSAIAMVVRTGIYTELGKIQKGVTEAKSEEHKTPLGIKLDEFGDQLTKIIGVICLAVWAVSIPKFKDPTFKNAMEGGLYYAKVAVALGVAAIPEGLPAVITLCLSLGTRRMAKRNGK